MMKFIAAVSAFALVGFAHCANDTPQDYRLTLREEKPCTSAGLMCNSCGELVTCVSDINGFHKISVEMCGEGQTCLGTSCTTDPNPLCEPELRFICKDVGVFPDPFDCKSYHFCVSDGNTLIDYKTECDDSYGYHAGSTFCGVKLFDNVCFYDPYQFPVDICHASGQTAALRDNPSIYYICAHYSSTDHTLYPFLYVCPHGGTYYYYECSSLYKKNLEELMKRF